MHVAFAIVTLKSTASSFTKNPYLPIDILYFPQISSLWALFMVPSPMEP